MTLIRLGEAIPFGRPYRTHPNGPRKLLTTRKRVRPIPARRLAWRRVSHHSSDRHSSSDSSSSSAPSDHSLSRHPPPDTTDADSSTPQRFVHRSLARTPRHSSSSERSLDSSSPSPRPSRKRCRSLTASVPSSTHVSRSIAPTHADLLPPRKRFRDSYSLDDSGEEHMEVDIADVEAVADIGISEGVIAHPKEGVGMGFEIAASDVREDDEEFEAKVSAAYTRKIAVDPLVIEVRIDRITEIETTQRQLETSQMVASRERASLVERIGSLRLEYLKVRAMLSIERDRIDSIRWHMALSQEEFRQVRRDRDDTRRRLRRLESTMTITRSSMTPEAIEELINRHVEEALAAHEATRAANALEAENQSQNGSDDDNGNGSNGDGENGNGGNGNPNENGRGDRPVARECTYQDFMKCQPLNFKGMDGAYEIQMLFRMPTLNGPICRIGYAVKNAENKRRLEVNQRDNHGQQPPFKRPNAGGQNVARAYTACKNEKKPYNGLLSFGNKCQVVNQRVITCFECGRQGHFRSDCPKLKDQNRRNKAGNKNGVGEARGKAYVLGGGDANPDSYVIKGTFLLNNLYAFILFDSGADRSFVSTTFSTLLDITPDTLDVSYAVELADGRFFRQIPCLEVVR
ncbi:reverse transcriptase domain-containing protein [Tanacetum coccineum]